VIREDRELLAELARLNTDMVPLVMTIMGDGASAAEQAHYAGRLIAAGKRLQRRADQMAGIVVEGEVLASGSLTFSPSTAQARRER
jgi:hypothetical protein